MVKAEPDGTNKGRGEAMSFLGCDDLSRAEAAEFDVVHPVGSRVRGPVKQVSSIQTVFSRELMVDPSRHKIFIHNLLTSESEYGGVAVPEGGPVRDRVKGKIGLRL